jgi:hypothetical protein
MALKKVASSPLAQLHKAIYEVQKTTLRNTQLDCKMNEALAQQDHSRFITIKVAYLHFLRCNHYTI